MKINYLWNARDNRITVTEAVVTGMARWLRRATCRPTNNDNNKKKRALIAVNVAHRAEQSRYNDIHDPGIEPLLLIIGPTTDEFSDKLIRS